MLAFRWLVIVPLVFENNLLYHLTSSARVGKGIAKDHPFKAKADARKAKNGVNKTLFITNKTLSVTNKVLFMANKVLLVANKITFRVNTTLFAHRRGCFRVNNEYRGLQ